jgi:hypothetical protein
MSLDLKQFEMNIAKKRAVLLAHPIYSSLNDVQSLRLFMEHHVFAVWDFMSLLKRLQQALTSIEIPWMPPERRLAARFINEIVLVEESDEVSPGVFMSHFELYLEAMHEIGADSRPIENLLSLSRANLVNRLHSNEELGVWRFMSTTFALASSPVHQVAAAFLYGREDIIPEMFERILNSLDDGQCTKFISFRRYLERHIEVDGQAHGPLARKILQDLCGADPVRWNESLAAAHTAIEARIHLWDCLLSRLDGRFDFRQMKEKSLFLEASD